MPDAIDSAAGDETAYDCALVLVAGAAEQALGQLDGKRQAIADRAARVLANHLGALDDLGGREFSDPGFLAYAWPSTRARSATAACSPARASSSTGPSA